MPRSGADPGAPSYHCRYAACKQRAPAQPGACCPAFMNPPPCCSESYPSSPVGCGQCSASESPPCPQSFGEATPALRYRPASRRPGGRRVPTVANSGRRDLYCPMSIQSEKVDAATLSQLDRRPQSISMTGSEESGRPLGVGSSTADGREEPVQSVGSGFHPSAVRVSHWLACPSGSG